MVDVNARNLSQVVEACRKHAPRTAGFPCDVADSAVVGSAHQKICRHLGPASVMVNCCGIGHFAPFLEIDLQDWVRMFSVNVMGAAHFTRVVLSDTVCAGVLSERPWASGVG
jgi:NAD(P)-dependent dehydrogenase (short-subunit alcohol dehydrogenase family)